MLLLLCSCTLKKAEKLPGFGLTLSAEKSALLTENLKTHPLKSLRSLLRVQQEYERQKASFRQAVAYQSENYLLLEAFPLNSFFTLNRLSVNPQKYSFKDFQAKKNYDGNFKDTLLSDFFGMDFTITEFAWLLLGKIPPEWQAQLSTADFYSNNVSYQINLNKMGIYLECDPKTYALQRVIAYDLFRDKVKLSIQYSNYEKLNGYAYPQEIKLHFAGRDLKIDVRQKLNSVNEKIPASLFN